MYIFGNCKSNYTPLFFICQYTVFFVGNKGETPYLSTVEETHSPVGAIAIVSSKGKGSVASFLFLGPQWGPKIMGVLVRWDHFKKGLLPFGCVCLRSLCDAKQRPHSSKSFSFVLCSLKEFLFFGGPQWGPLNKLRIHQLRCTKQQTYIRTLFYIKGRTPFLRLWC